jgi:hypothetical protein
MCERTKYQSRNILQNHVVRINIHIFNRTIRPPSYDVSPVSLAKLYETLNDYNSTYFVRCLYFVSGYVNAKRKNNHVEK